MTGLKSMLCLAFAGGLLSCTASNPLPSFEPPRSMLWSPGLRAQQMTSDDRQPIPGYASRKDQRLSTYWGTETDMVERTYQYVHEDQAQNDSQVRDHLHVQTHRYSYRQTVR